MIDTATVCRLALSLPEVEDISSSDCLGFAVAGKKFAWTYLKKTGPKGPRHPHPEVLAVRCPMVQKEMLMAAAPEVFFEDDHYRGYPAVLVRLTAVDDEELAGLIEGAWDLQAPKRLKP